MERAAMLAPSWVVESGTCNHALRLWLPPQAECQMGHQRAQRPGLNPSFSGPQLTHLGNEGLASIPAPDSGAPKTVDLLRLCR